MNHYLTEDVVNNPKHYTEGGIEVIDYLKAKMTGEEFIGFLRGNVMKYVSRAGKKDDVVQDYEKARWYLNKLIETLSGKEAAKVMLVDNPENLIINKISHRQNGYICGLCKKLDLDHRNMPDDISPLPDVHDLTEMEASDLIERLLVMIDQQKRVLRK